jgi:hypothetical protein
LSDRFDLDDLLTLASQLDAGFTSALLAEMLASHERFADQDIADLDGDPTAVRGFIEDWRHEINARGKGELHSSVGEAGGLPGPMVEGLEHDLAYLQERGYEVAIEERDLHAMHIAPGEPGQASFFVEGRRYHVVDLLRDGRVVAPAYGVGESPQAALARARRRYGSEQG